MLQLEEREDDLKGRREGLDGWERTKEVGEPAFLLLSRAGEAEKKK